MAYRIDQTDALLQQSWENKLWEESQERDIFTGLVGTYSDKKEMLTDSAVMRVNMPEGANSHTIGLILDLTGSGRQGAGKVLVGFTESFDTRKYQVYANDVRHGVDTEQYGRYAQLNSPYKILEKANPALGKWLKARRGKHAREALLELYSDNLIETPSSQTQGWNKNWLVKNVAHSAQPTYDSTLATFTANITTALVAAGTAAAAQADIRFFTDLEYFIATQWKLMPFDDGTYVVTVPARQAMYLKRFNTGRNAAADFDSFSSHLGDASVAKYVEAAYGQYLMKFGKLHLIADDRAPIVNYNVAAGSITAYYRDVGSTDDRSDITPAAGTDNVYDIGYVIGKGGLTEGVAMRPRYDDDITDFNRLRSVGVSTTYGFQCTEFDADTATDATRINQNSAVCAFYAGAATT